MPLVPFIDLLLCCVMFLLVTAVWNQLDDLTVRQQVPGDVADALPPPVGEELVVRLRADGAVELASSYGDRFEFAPDASDELAERLVQRREVSRGPLRVVVAPEDGVSYERIVGVTDVIAGAGYGEVTLADGAGI